MAVKHAEQWQRWLELKELPARDQLIEQYLWLVRYVAGRLVIGLPAHYEQSDLEGHGCLGLMAAVDRYDPARGVRFETYAIPWVRGAIFEGIRALQWAPAMRKRARQLLQANQALEHSLGRSPTQDELATHMGLSLEEVDQRTAELGTLATLSLDEQVAGDEGDGASLADRLADESAPDPSILALLSERRDLLTAAIGSLSEQERTVISLIYYDGLIAREVSEVLGLSPARISQLHGQAILRLRGKLSRMKSLLVS